MIYRFIQLINNKAGLFLDEHFKNVNFTLN